MAPISKRRRQRILAAVARTDRLAKSPPPAATVSLTCYDAAKDRISDLIERSDGHRAEKYKIARKLERSVANSDDLEADLAEKSSELTSINKTLQAVQKALNQVQIELESSSLAGNLLRSENRSLKTQLYNLQRQFDRLAATQSRALQDQSNQANLVSLYSRGGIISNPTREMLRSLAALGVAERKMTSVVDAVATGFGLILTDSVSARSIRRIVLEGYIASMAQIGDECRRSEGI